MYGRSLVGTTILGLVPATIVSLATWIVAETHATRSDVCAALWQHSLISNRQDSFTFDERARLGEQALAHLRRSRGVRNQRLRVLSIKSLPSEKAAPRRSRVGVVIFNYSQGNATRLIMDSSTGAVLRVERLSGRPQPSEEEREEGRRVIRAVPEYARMLEAGGVLEGGFVVDAPRRRSMRGRFIQFQILTPDRQGLQRLVIVNLTTGRIAEARQR